MKNDLPFQVEHLINSLLNTKENVHLRQNYRIRLDSIRESIEKSIKKYDNELYMANTKKKRA
jgi:hypothetical protein